MNKFVKLDNEKNAATVEIRSLSHDGRGIGIANNKKLFVSGALPGETVTYHITQKRSQYSNAEVVDILTAAPERVNPPCQHFGVCGGCSLQHMSVEMQIAAKQQVLLDQLKHFGHVEPETVLPPLHALATGYRRKARLGVKFVIKKNKLLVGFREKSSRYLADLEHCAVLHPSVGARLPELSQLIASLSLYQHIAQIEVAIGDHDTALIFRHLEPLPESDQNKLRDFAERTGIHIYLQPNPPQALVKLWPPNAPDRLTYSLPDEDLTYLFHPLDFTQVNLEMNRLMVQQALTLLDVQPHETALDLFCGIGNFTLPIAKRAAQVTGVEGGVEMVERAYANAKHNGIENVSFYAANLQQPPLAAAWMKTTYDKILLDPPRVGAKEMLPYFNQFAAKRIVYISCNPATLARDAGELVSLYHYKLKQVGVMNMFPHTSHIESIAVFEKS